MADTQAQLPPHALLGIMQRTLHDLHNYLYNPPAQIDVEMCKNHLAPVWNMLDKLGEMQAEANVQGGNGEARAQ